MTGPEAQGMQQLLFPVLPTIVAFILGIWFTKGTARIVILCLFCTTLGAAGAWIAKGEIERPFGMRASACFHEQYVRTHPNSN
jgi:hypothetical protein